MPSLLCNLKYCHSSNSQVEKQNKTNLIILYDQKGYNNPKMNEIFFLIPEGVYFCSLG